LVEINIEELPKDIQEGLKSLYSNRLENAKTIVFCADIQEYNKEK
jgi:hypothetical protein